MPCLDILICLSRLYLSSGEWSVLLSRLYLSSGEWSVLSTVAEIPENLPTAKPIKAVGVS